ncbi:hypothetical protein EZS27_031352 [termite gut metagenome]|uniref:Uncharacterized protein n=1 Tax=termite gut metagenome TaxID=433724 RepID=A0A5J4QCB8_9ZZZZ
MDKHLIINKNLPVRAVGFFWTIFTPLIIPFGMFLILFIFSYLHVLPLGYKLTVLGIVFCFTIIIPVLTFRLYYRVYGYSRQNRSDRSIRRVLLLLTVISYLFCFCTMLKLRILWYMTGIILATLLILVVFLIFSLRWKLCEHAAGIGGIIGGLVSYSALSGYNPLWWLCVFILIAGGIGSCSIISHHRSLSEVLIGFFVGFVFTLLVLHPTCNVLSRLLISIFNI